VNARYVLKNFANVRAQAGREGITAETRTVTASYSVLIHESASTPKISENYYGHGNTSSFFEGCPKNMRQTQY